MKKFIALLLVALLAVPAAFAFSASAEATNVALNKTYTIDTGSKEVNGTYNAKLTDGKAEEEVKNAVDETDNLNYWFGFNWKQQFDINEDGETYVASVTLDLGETTKGLTSTKIHLGRKEDWSVFLPESLVVSVSADGETFTEVGAATGSVENEASGWAELALGGKEARYVRYTFTAINKEGATHAWIFLNEIEVYADPNAASSEPETKPEPVKETITVDGKLDDTGWAEDGWIEASIEKGNAGIQDTPDEKLKDAFSFKVQLRTDDEYLYVATIVDHELVKSEGVGAESKRGGLSWRMWFHNDAEYAQYTMFYDIWPDANGDTCTAAKYNTSKDSNSGAAIENSTMTGFVKEADGKTVYEFSVKISEVVKDGGDTINFYINPVNGNTNDYFVGMLYPPIPLDKRTEQDQTYMPWIRWDTEDEGKLKLADVKLGEITPDTTDESGTSETEGPSYEETIKANMGPANENGKFEVELTGPQNYKAGEEIEITATVKNIAADAKLAQITFNLGFDTAKFELVNGN
ncbi:MAG: hypothetical protein IJQ53_08870, partial [Clostridia bacterium]|nr:hypothetical protein [Clostridia bacterium]